MGGRRFLEPSAGIPAVNVWGIVSAAAGGRMPPVRAWRASVWRAGCPHAAGCRGRRRRQSGCAKRPGRAALEPRGRRARGTGEPDGRAGRPAGMPREGHGCTRHAAAAGPPEGRAERGRGRATAAAGPEPTARARTGPRARHRRQEAGARGRPAGRQQRARTCCRGHDARDRLGRSNAATRAELQGAWTRALFAARRPDGAIRHRRGRREATAGARRRARPVYASIRPGHGTRSRRLLAPSPRAH